MHRGVLARLGVVLLLVAAPLAPLALVDEPRPTADRSTDLGTERALEQLRWLPPGGGTPDGDALDAERTVSVELTLAEGTRLPAAIDPEQVYTRADSRLVAAQVPARAIRALGHHPRFESVTVNTEVSAGEARVADGVAALGAASLHARGITGESASVGVIGTGFRPGHAEVAGSVATYRTFEAGDADWRHGTAVASVVADTAPGADLHLAAVGPTTTRSEYAAAVSWLRENGVDVIVDAGSYFGEGGGEGSIAAVAERAADDVLFVTSAGNYARRHWRGVHVAGGGPNWVSFADGEQGNFLAGGDRFGGQVRVGLQWDGAGAPDGYDLYLLREQWGDDEVMAVAEGAGGAARLETSVPPGRYYLAVRAVNASGVNRVELFANRRLAHRTAAGSVTAPGTVDSVFVVGAASGDAVAPYSSRGSAVDAVAPASVAMAGLADTNGTSYAAPYAAGLAALVYQEHDPRPRSVAAMLRVSARDVGAPGFDAAAGHGRLDAPGAYRLARAWSRVEETVGAA